MHKTHNGTETVLCIMLLENYNFIYYNISKSKDNRKIQEGFDFMRFLAIINTLNGWSANYKGYGPTQDDAIDNAKNAAVEAGESLVTGKISVYREVEYSNQNSSEEDLKNFEFITKCSI